MHKRLFPLAMMSILVCLSGCQVTGQAVSMQSATATADAQVLETQQQATVSAVETQWKPVDVQACAESACTFPGHFLLHNPIPVEFNQIPDLTYLFGSTQEDEREIHHGIEFANPSGTPVLAVADGQVVHAGDDSLAVFGLNTNFYGNLVLIQHDLPGFPEDLYTLYAHLSQVSVNQGEPVKAGQEIGRVGRSGSASGSHLHFEVRLGGNRYSDSVDPLLWLQPILKGGTPDAGALAGIVLDAGGEVLQVSNIQLQYSQSQAGPVERQRTISTYFDEGLQADPVYPQNFALSNLTPGWYRVTLIINGVYLSDWVQVFPGKLTYLTIRLN